MTKILAFCCRAGYDSFDHVPCAVIHDVRVAHVDHVALPPGCRQRWRRKATQAEAANVRSGDLWGDCEACRPPRDPCGDPRRVEAAGGRRQQEA